jgi:flagellar hook-associated protein 1 FlgK
MSLNSALSIAAGGLANINAQFALISQNVANASTPGYAVEVGNQQALTADGMGLGVQTGPATVQIDQALQQSVQQQNALVSNLQTTQTALQTIDSALGTPGSGTDIGSLLGNLQDSFSTLLTDPSNTTQQNAVVGSATTLAQGINALSDAYTTQRQQAQDNLQSAVGTLNSTLATIGQLNSQIVTLQAGGQSTADLQNQRNAAVQTLSQLLNVNTVAQPDGALTLFTPGGLTLPTQGSAQGGATPFTMASSSIQPGSYYPGGGISGIMLDGTDITNEMTGGQIGADVTLRDTTLPTDQAELDEFAQGLSSRFASQGLTLFSDPQGNVPASGGAPVQSSYVGYAATIQVNAAVAADPSLVRDGTNAVSGTGFTPNPASGPAGFSALITNVLTYTFGSQVQNGVAQPTLNTSGLGASGTLGAPFSAGGGTLADYVTSLVSTQAEQSATITGNLTGEQSLQTSLTTKLSAVSGVNMDTEVSQMLSLQNAYGANARVIAGVQAMFAQLLQVVQ